MRCGSSKTTQTEEAGILRGEKRRRVSISVERVGDSSYGAGGDFGWVLLKYFGEPIKTTRGIGTV